MKYFKILLLAILLIFIAGCTENHTHNLSEYEHDEIYHYKVCSDCHEITLKEEHTFSDGVIVRPATKQLPGIKKYKCTVCGFEKEEEYLAEIEEHIHIDVNNISSLNYLTFNQVIINETNLNEFTIKKENGYISSNSITKITKIVCDVYGALDIIKMYDDNTEITPSKKMIFNASKTSTEYTYNFTNPSDYFKLINESNYNAEIFSIDIYYNGIINNPLTPIEIEKIELGFTDLSMIIGTQKILKPVIYPINATNKILSFNSNNEEIAMISEEGVIEALGIGEVTIDITSSNNIKVSFTLTVQDESISTDDGFFTIYNIEMMGTYGDSNLIKYGDYDILIDGGTTNDSAYIKKVLDENVEDHVLEYLIISHPDTDHYEGLISMTALSSVEEIDNVVTNGNSDNSRILNALKTKYKNTNYQVITDMVSLKDKIYTVNIAKEFSLNFYYQDNYLNTSSNKNNQSIVSTINYQNCIVFLAGDLESNGCKSVMKYYPNLTSDDNYVIYKALHHGSKGTNYADFLSFIKPDMCFISAGMRLTEPHYTPNYGSHPYIEAVDRMGKKTKEVYWSGICGTIEITCDGETATCKGTGRSKDYYYMRSSDSSTYIKASRDKERNVTYFESAYYLMAIDFLGYPTYTSQVNVSYFPYKKESQF